MTFAPVAAVPVYNHPHFLPTLVDALRAQGLAVILVDDGSNADCAAVIDTLCQRESVFCVRHPENRGKGGAVMSGLREAQRRGYSHALQIDADGQHNLADIPRLLDTARAHPAALVTGRPLYDESVPKGRLYSRYITHVWIWINTLSLSIRDSMCGFRVYPVPASVALLDRVDMGTRMSFDPEILVRFHWTGGEIINVDTPVRYPEDGISHFRMLEDNLRLSRMHATLFFGMLLRLPLLLARKFTRPKVAA